MDLVPLWNLIFRATHACCAALSSPEDHFNCQSQSIDARGGLFDCRTTTACTIKINNPIIYMRWRSTKYIHLLYRAVCRRACYIPLMADCAGAGCRSCRLVAARDDEKSWQNLWNEHQIIYLFSLKHECDASALADLFSQSTIDDICQAARFSAYSLVEWSPGWVSASQLHIKHDPPKPPRTATATTTSCVDRCRTQFELISFAVLY